MIENHLWIADPQLRRFDPPQATERPKMKLKKPKVRVKQNTKPKSTTKIVTKSNRALMPAMGITRLRGKWGEVLGRPALPTFHPAALLRNPLQKRPVWADLLALQARMEASSA